jgi:hypothetical protein
MLAIRPRRHLLAVGNRNRTKAGGIGRGRCDEGDVGPRLGPLVHFLDPADILAPRQDLSRYSFLFDPMRIWREKAFIAIDIWPSQ